MEIKNLKEGDALYRLVYWHGIGVKRELSKYTIKKVNKKSISFKGVSWKVTEEELNKENWSKQKLKCYEYSLKLHEAELVKLEDKEMIISFKKEIKYLNRKISELAENTKEVKK